MNDQLDGAVHLDSVNRICAAFSIGREDIALAIAKETLEQLKGSNDLMLEVGLLLQICLRCQTPLTNDVWEHYCDRLLSLLSTREREIIDNAVLGRVIPFLNTILESASASSRLNFQVALETVFGESGPHKGGSHEQEVYCAVDE